MYEVCSRTLDYTTTTCDFPENRIVRLPNIYQIYQIFVRHKHECPHWNYFPGNTYTFVNITTKTSKIFITFSIDTLVLDMECTYQYMISVPVNNYKLLISEDTFGKKMLVGELKRNVQSIYIH